MGHNAAEVHMDDWDHNIEGNIIHQIMIRWIVQAQIIWLHQVSSFDFLHKLHVRGVKPTYRISSNKMLSPLMHFFFF